ncbi:MAG: hypothetical protein V1717_00865 [Candidatus Micrarchaeota archaeon]
MKFYYYLGRRLLRMAKKKGKKKTITRVKKKAARRTVGRKKAKSSGKGKKRRRDKFSFDYGEVTKSEEWKSDWDDDAGDFESEGGGSEEF